MAFSSATSTGNVKIKIEPNPDQYQENDLETTGWINELIDFKTDTNDDEKETNYEVAGDNAVQVEEVLMTQFFQPFNEIALVETCIKNKISESNYSKNTRVNRNGKDGNDKAGHIDKPTPIQPSIIKPTMSKLELKRARQRVKMYLKKSKKAEEKAQRLKNSKDSSKYKKPESTTTQTIINPNLSNQSRKYRIIEQKMNSNDPFKCTYCKIKSSAFPNLTQLNYHILDFHTYKGEHFKCDFLNCGRIFISKGDLNIHQNEHERDQPLQYQHYLHLQLLEKNLENDTSKNDTKLMPEPESTNVKPNMLLKKPNVNNGSRTCKKTIVQRTFCSKNLDDHKMSHLKSQNDFYDSLLTGSTATVRKQKAATILKLPQALKFHCSECTEKFPNFSLLNKHLKSHSRDGSLYYCTCGRGFLNEALLKVHYITSKKCVYVKSYSKSKNRSRSDHL